MSKESIMEENTEEETKGSDKYKLGLNDLWKLGKGALLAGLGASGSYLLMVGLPSSLNKQELLLLGAALFSVGLNAAHKFLTDTRA